MLSHVFPQLPFLGNIELNVAGKLGACVANRAHQPNSPALPISALVPQHAIELWNHAHGLPSFNAVLAFLSLRVGTHCLAGKSAEMQLRGLDAAEGVQCQCACMMLIHRPLTH